MGKKLQLMLAMFACMVSSGPAMACIVAVPMNIRDIRSADLVFVGEITGYEIVRSDDSPNLQDYALLTARIDQVLRGSSDEAEIELYWQNSTFGYPAEMMSFEPAIIAATDPREMNLPLRGPSATIVPAHRTDLLQVLQAPCSGPIILPGEQEDVAVIEAVLAGDDAAAENYWLTAPPEQSALPPGEPAELVYISARETQAADRERIVAISVLGNMALTAAIVFALRRRRQRQASR